MAAPLDAAVIVFPGSNGDRDLAETLARAGFKPRFVRSSEPLPAGVALVGLPGGFSYGDYWRAGMLASQARAVQDLPAFVAGGGLVIGICNGFQILVEADLLPGALTYNSPPGFRHRWLEVEVREACASPWFYGIPAGTRWRWPMAHGEGNYFHPEGVKALTGRIPLTYTKNPNGSLGDAAAVLDPTGRVLGVMPHPERASEPDVGGVDGMHLFLAAHRGLTEQHANVAGRTS